jgi:hypothetical protein
VAIAVAALAATATSARSSTAGCESAARGLTTLSDPQRRLVNLEPKDTTLDAIAQLPRPNPTPATRDTAFERRVWRLSAQITEFRLEADGEIQLVLFDAGVYGIAKMPAPGCVPKNARARQAIVKARQRFVRACGQATNSWKPLGAVVNISGVGFWDKPHTQEPHAANFAEQDPVTDMQIVAGCR